MKKYGWMKPAKSFDEYCYRYTIISLVLMVLGFVAKVAWAAFDEDSFWTYYTKKGEAIEEAADSLIKKVDDMKLIEKFTVKQ